MNDLEQRIADEFGELNNNLGGCSFEQEGDVFYIVGADSVRKKLGSTGLTLVGSFSAKLPGTPFDESYVSKYGYSSVIEGNFTSLEPSEYVIEITNVIAKVYSGNRNYTYSFDSINPFISKITPTSMVIANTSVIFGYLGNNGVYASIGYSGNVYYNPQ